MLRSGRPGDEPALEAFLSRYADFSMFLRSNSRAAGLTYEGKRLKAHYVAAFEGDESWRDRCSTCEKRECGRRSCLRREKTPNGPTGAIGFRVVGEYGVVLFGGK
jgi:hypothetical protein